MRALLTGVVAAIEAIAVALASLLGLAAYAFLVWWLAFGLAAEPSYVFGGAGAAWLLAHFVPLTVSLTPETMQVLGFAPEALAFPISLAPLGVTLVTTACAVRAGWRLAARGGIGAVGLGTGALGFGAVAAMICAVIPAEAPVAAAPGALAAGAIAACVFGVAAGLAFAIRAARDEHDWWLAALAWCEKALARLSVPRPRVIAAHAGSVLRLAALFAAGYAGLAALAFTAALLTRFALVIASAETLQLDVWGTILMFVLQLALLPVFVLWSGAWLSGAGFSIGAGSSASPFGQLLGPMPGVPALAAIPDGWGSFAIIAPLLLVLLGVFLGAGLGERAKRHTVLQLAIQVVLAAALTGVAVALLNWAAAGALGPGRLGTVGPEVWPVAGLVAAEIGVGGLLGAFAARADLIRRVAQVPTEAASRLGLHEHTKPGVAAELGTDTDTADGPGAGGAGPEAEAEAEPVPELAPVAQLVPHTAPGRTRWGQPPGGEPQDPFDDQPTAPVDELRERPDFGSDATDSDAIDTDVYNTDVYNTDVYETDAFGVGGPAGDVRDGSDAELTQALQPDAELFDQHEVAEVAEAAEVVGAGGQPGEMPAADSGRAIDADALVEAYSWDNLDATATPEPETKRTGWRWPGRKG